MTFPLILLTLSLLSTAAVPIAPVENSSWTVLFDGESLEHWRGVRAEAIPTEIWSVEEGWLKTRPNWSLGGDLVTREEFFDFEMTFEWRLAEGANSGVKYLVDLESRDPVREDLARLTGVLSLFALITLILLIAAVPRRRSAKVSALITFALLLACLYSLYNLLQPGTGAVGLEMQLVDGGTTLSETETSGALYDLKAPNAVASLRAGHVNRGGIRVEGTRVEHWINDRMVLAYSLEERELAAPIQESKYSSIPEIIEKKGGFIALQNHRSEVWFRNIRIRRLASTVAP